LGGARSLSVTGRGFLTDVRLLNFYINTSDIQLTLAVPGLADWASLNSWETPMTDLKTLDARIQKLQAQLTRMQNRRQRIEVRELKLAEKVRRDAEQEKRALAGELLLGAVARGEIPRATVALWCDTLDLERGQRDLLGI